MTPQEQTAEIQTALRQDTVRLNLVHGFNLTTGGSVIGVAIERERVVGDRKRWERVGPTIYPAKDQTLGDVLKIIGDWAEGGGPGVAEQ